MKSHSLFFSEGFASRLPSRLKHVFMIAVYISTMAANAALPAPTPEEAKAAAEKKAQTETQAEKDKQALAASMDALASRWRERAKANGWQTYPPTPVSAVQGFNASATQSSPSGQPQGRQGAAAQLPIRSEKHRTAAPSADVKPPSKPNTPPLSTKE